MDAYKESLAQDENPNQACCVLCCRSFLDRYNRKYALNQHAKTETHQNAVGAYKIFR